MKSLTYAAPLAALFLTAAPAMAAHAPVQASASIPFANHHGVRDWVAQGNDTIYFQDSARRWYKAVLFAPSMELPFATAIGIDSGPMGTLDRWGAVIVRGQRYPFQSFERVAGPPPRKGEHHHEAQAPAS